MLYGETRVKEKEMFSSFAHDCIAGKFVPGKIRATCTRLIARRTNRRAMEDKTIFDRINDFSFSLLHLHLLRSDAIVCPRDWFLGGGKKMWMRFIMPLLRLLINLSIIGVRLSVMPTGINRIAN